MAELRPLPGIGRKTANCVLGNAYGLSEGITVDTHVLRLSRLLGLSRQTDAEKLERDLMRSCAARRLGDGQSPADLARTACVHCESAEVRGVRALEVVSEQATVRDEKRGERKEERRPPDILAFR